MTGWRWVDPKVVRAVREAQLAEHGGLDGVRDPGLVASALARPINLAAYGQPDAAALAAAYAFGLARNHGFADANKRTAWVVARLFLADNGFILRFDRADAVRFMESVAAGETDEAATAEWFRLRLLPRELQQLQRQESADDPNRQSAGNQRQPALNEIPD